jgi:hypothetical protein
MAKKRRDYEFERKVGAMVDALRLARALEFVERVVAEVEERRRLNARSNHVGGEVGGC